MRVLFCQTHYRVPGTEIKYRTSAVDWWRLINPAQALSRHTDWQIGLRRDIIDEDQDEEAQYLDIGQKYDLVVSSYHHNGKVLGWMDLLNKKYGTKYAVDYDDDVINIPPGNPVFHHFENDKPKYALTLALLDLAPAVITTNRHLKHTYKHQSKQRNIYIIPNYIDFNTYTPTEKVPHKTINIGFQGSVSHLTDLCLTPFRQAILDTLKHYKHARFYIFGASHYDEFDNHPQIEYKNGTGDFNEFVPQFKEWGRTIDIGVSPLIVSDFTQGKSGIKALEYASQRIPVVATAIRQYNEVIETGHNGYLPTTYDEWMYSLKQLIENRQLRDQFADNLYEHVYQNWNIDVKYPVIVDQLESIYYGRRSVKENKWLQLA